MKRAWQFAFTVILAGLAGVGRADDIEGKINAMIDKAVVEWTLLVTCTALDSGNHDFLVAKWEQTKSRSKSLMQEKHIDNRKIEEYLTRMGKLAPSIKSEAPAADLMAYCHAHPEWERLIRGFKFIIPHDALATILGGRA